MCLESELSAFPVHIAVWILVSSARERSLLFLEESWVDLFPFLEGSCMDLILFPEGSCVDLFLFLEGSCVDLFLF